MADHPTSDGADLSQRATTIALAAILVAALALRLYGLSWDEGFSWTPHPDERAILFKVVEIAPPGLGDIAILLDAERSPWNPKWFPYGSFPLYLLKTVDTLWGYLPGVGSEDLRVPARAVSALADVATILVVYLIGRAVWSRKVGILAAGLVAFAVIHVQLSHFFAVDTLMALFATATLYFLLRVARRGRRSDSALAGLFIGLALATKVSVAPILAAYVVAHFIYATGLAPASTGHQSSREPVEPMSIFDRMSAGVKSALVGLAVMVGTLLVVQPYAFLDWSRFYADFVEQSEMVRRIRDYPYTRQYIDTTPYLYHVQQLATWGLGLPLGVIVWAGSVYAAVKGLRVWYAVGYLVFGIALPATILVASSGFAATLLASAIAVGALVVTIPLRSQDTRLDTVLLSWVVPYFLIVGAFDVKFMRYMIPITPVLMLFGARMAVDIWHWARRAPVGIEVAIAVVSVAVIAATAFYGVSYTGVYREAWGERHPAVRASEWIKANAPRGSVILKEHWEEGLPRLYEYEIEELPMYEPDQPSKLRRMSELLSEADYMTLYSNRLYGTVSRLPERYPVSREYYRQLFSGGIGYTLDAHFTSYPNLFGVGFVDETFERPDLPPPGRLSEARPYPVSINLGYADESFSVYDHPKVLVFRNVERLDPDEIARRIVEGSEGYPVVEIPTGWQEVEPGRQLILTPREAANRQAGGTWSRIFDTGGPVIAIGARAPALVWFIVVEVIALVSVPLCFIAFRPLADRGWLMSKAVGLLIVGLGVWLLASLELMAFSRSTAFAVLMAFAAVNAVLLIANRDEIAEFLKRRWKTVAVAEVVFLAAFVAFVIIRMANPDLWHPYRGGEKPMDFAYLNAVLKSVHMPPYDPWFAGGYLNYYYWGQFLVATLIHMTGIVPEVAVNLAVPTFFAMTAALSYSVAYNLASWVGSHQQTPSPPYQVRDRLLRERVGVRVNTYPSPVYAGIAGVAFVTVLGNLDGAIQLGQSAWRAVIQGLPSGEFDFWRSSRMMPPDPPGHEITEFPFFTFLFADPHAHLWALPFTLLCVGLSASVALGLARSGSPRSVWRPGHLLTLAMLGVAVGALRLLNTWDYPTYLLFGFAAIALGEYLAQGGLSGGVIFRAAAKSALVLAVGFVVFMPFHMTNETFFLGIERTTNQTALWQLLAIFGLFVYVIGSYCLWTLRRELAAAWNGLRRGHRSVSLLLSGRAMPDSVTVSGLSVHVGPSLAIAGVSAALLVGFLLTALLSGSDWGSVVFAGALLVLVGLVGLRSLIHRSAETPVAAFAALAAGTALAIVIGLDFVRVEGDIERMNSVFKFYLQVWTLLALAAAYFTWRMAGALTRDGDTRLSHPHSSRADKGRCSQTVIASPAAWRVPAKAGTQGRSVLRQAQDERSTGSPAPVSPSRERGLAWKYHHVWAAGLVVLVLSAAVYPVFGTQDRLRDRFDASGVPLTLDGLAYASDATYFDRQGPIDLGADLEGIRWLRENVQGSPVILEGNTPTYRWGGRVSIHTGLPSVVGWRWHQQQQRWDYRDQVDLRIWDVDQIYSTADPAEAVSLLDRYGVKYIYVGQVERLYYPERGLAKFEDALSSRLTPVFHTDQVTIYEFTD